jgi:HlyD family secretion protein
LRFYIKSLLVLGVLAGIGGVSYGPAKRFYEERNRPKWRTQKLQIGELVQTVNATGKVEPVKRVSVGASVSGPISELFVDFNDTVTKGQVMARIDQRLYKASVERDNAFFKTRKAEVARAEAMLQQSKNDEKRADQLRKVTEEFISDAEMDQMFYSKLMREAELEVAKTNVEQSQAQLDNSLANLNFTEIVAPCDGIVIDRKVDIGQTLAAQFQTPEMFVVAPNMEERMHIYASVDEADIGLIRRAQESGQVVRFTVDAYRDELFEKGKIVQVRLASKVEQNVVTYPVIVETPNEKLKLLPGMTASLSFQIEKKEKARKIPNAALRFYPARERVHPDDHKILDGTEEQKRQVEDSMGMMSADEKATSNRAVSRRHVWIWDGAFLKAKAVVVGISDNRFTELIEGDVSEADELVVGEDVTKK